MKKNSQEPPYNGKLESCSTFCESIISRNAERVERSSSPVSVLDGLAPSDRSWAQDCKGVIPVESGSYYGMVITTLSQSWVLDGPTAYYLVGGRSYYLLSRP